MTRRSATALALIGASTLAVYFPVLTSLVRQWQGRGRVGGTVHAAVYPRLSPYLP
jgi:hypothetical protein